MRGIFILLLLLTTPILGQNSLDLNPNYENPKLDTLTCFLNPILCDCWEEYILLNNCGKIEYLEFLFNGKLGKETKKKFKLKRKQCKGFQQNVLSDVSSISNYHGSFDAGKLGIMYTSQEYYDYDIKKWKTILGCE